MLTAYLPACLFKCSVPVCLPLTRQRWCYSSGALLQCRLPTRACVVRAWCVRCVCVVCKCGALACNVATCTSCTLCALCTLCAFCTLCTILPLIWSTIDFTRLAVHLSPIHLSKPTTEQVLWPICWTCVIQIWSSGTINMSKCDVTAVLSSLYALQKQACS